MEERYELAAMRRQGLRVAAMAEHLGRHRSTLYREVKRNQSAHDGRYRASHSVEKASGGRIGDWEMDTVHGRGKACVVTVVERKTGLVRIGPIPRATKELTLDRTVKLLWAERQRVNTITADNGTEFHNYLELESILDTEVYFAMPHHAWERGSNENTNGLIRQYLPKGTNLSRLTQRQCDRIAERLNDRPRLRLCFKTPNEAYYQP